VGFKLVWGCLVFYPFFYPIAIWCDIKPVSLSFMRQVLSIGVFFLGWILSRGANNQKYLFRTQPKEKFLGYFQPISINGRLLCSGWWSLSRHINYLGDILMATGLSLAINGGIYPWLYPLYYIGLFIGRERTDFERCQNKYGRDWNEYCNRVPNRIIPFIY
jgi:delta14-sterol reductase